MTPARTRFAPSPTGSLHIGGARTALYCLLWARKTGGQYLLRIEDTDRARSTEESAEGIVRDLEWLGLSWDEGPEVGGDRGPYFQSQRLPHYHEAIERLLAIGVAYLAYETREELQSLRSAAETNKETFRYQRIAYSDTDLARFHEEGRTPVVRLTAPKTAITIDDVILGEVTVEPEQLDDIVIRKADGFPTYHLAVVVDDQLMGVTQVLRGQEHLMNTHKHQGIADALDWELPAAGHMPLIFNLQGGKMSKREKAKAARAAAREASKARGSGKDYTWLAHATSRPVDEIDAFMRKKNDGVALAKAIADHLDIPLPMIDIMDFRQAGYLPEALVNYLALLGWRAREEGAGEGDKELWSVDELIAEFDLKRIKKTAARFDPAKLEWMNGEYMKSLPTERLLEVMDGWLACHDSPLATISRDRRGALLALYRGRANTFVELEQQAHFFLERPTTWGPPKAIKRHLLKGDGLARLRMARALVADIEDWTEGGIQSALQAWAEERELNMGKLAQPLRIAIAGGPVSPPIDATLAMLPQEEVLVRCDATLAHFADHA